MTQYYWEVALIVVVFSCIFLSCPFFRGVWPDFYRWLKGSRTSYYLTRFSSGVQVGTTTERLRCGLDYLLGGNFAKGLIIEINRGPFRRLSSIHGCGLPERWTITKDWDTAGGDLVCLEETRGLPVGTALQMVNTYPSLQAMFDRIAELEKKLRETELEKSEWAAGMESLRRRIVDNKQRFRSPAAKEIRDNIEEAFREMPAIKIDEHIVEKWLAFFEGRVYEEHPCDR